MKKIFSNPLSLFVIGAVFLLIVIVIALLYIFEEDISAPKFFFQDSDTPASGEIKCLGANYSDWKGCTSGSNAGFATKEILNYAPINCTDTSSVTTEKSTAKCKKDSTVCIAVNYTHWTDCNNSSGKMTRSIEGHYPEGCTDKSKIDYGPYSLECKSGGITPTSKPTEKTPTPTKPSTVYCNKYEYTAWGKCTLKPGTNTYSQERKITKSFPNKCKIPTSPTQGGIVPRENQPCKQSTPNPTKSAIPTSTPKGSTCTHYNYTDWRPCENGETKRTVKRQFPVGCNSSGNPPLTKLSCKKDSTTCTGANYSDWSECKDDGFMTRSLESFFPAACSNTTSYKEESTIIKCGANSEKNFCSAEKINSKRWAGAGIYCVSDSKGTNNVLVQCDENREVVDIKDCDECEIASPGTPDYCVNSTTSPTPTNGDIICEKIEVNADEYDSCRPNGEQSAKIISRTPSGCTLSKEQEEDLPSRACCVKAEFTDWECDSSSGKETRELEPGSEKPKNCTPNNFETVRECSNVTPTPTGTGIGGGDSCDEIDFSENYGQCVNGNQTREIESKYPDGCTPSQDQLDENSRECCESIEYGPFGECEKDSSGEYMRKREIISRSPSTCTPNNFEVTLEEECTPSSTGTPNPTATITIPTGSSACDFNGNEDGCCGIEDFSDVFLPNFKEYRAIKRGYITFDDGIIKGDYDRDGDVDIADFLPFRDDFIKGRRTNACTRK